MLAGAMDRGELHHAVSACKRAHLSSALRLVTPSFRSRWTCASFSVCGLLPAFRVGTCQGESGLGLLASTVPMQL